MKLTQDTGAQSTIDFLFGLAVFLMTFLYVFTFIPGLFVPYQASAVDLSSVAYKTGAVLAEDPGWYIYYNQTGTQMGDTAWETQNLTSLARIGLADDKLTPNVLSLDKINALSALYARGYVPELKDTSYDVIRDKLGLNGTLSYNFSLALVMNDTLAGRAETLLNVTPPFMGESVEHMERDVEVDTGDQLFVDCGRDASPSSVLQVDVSAMPADDQDNVTIRAYNATGPGTIDRVMWKSSPTDLPVPLLYQSQFIVRKNGVTLPRLASPYNSFNASDVIEIVVYNGQIRSNSINCLWVVSSKPVFPGTTISYFDDPTCQLHKVCYPGVLNIEVWANDYI